MGKLKAVFSIPELRLKILITLLFLAIYRIGYHIPVPFIDQLKMNPEDSGGGFGNVLKFVSMFSGGNLSQATIFGLGIMPYISASIIFQLLGAVYPPLEKLMKEGESGRKKITEYTRYATVVICLFQAWMYLAFLTKPRDGGGLGFALQGYDNTYYFITMVVTMTTGTVFLMWLGEQIDEFGIGNGISLIIMAGIVARLPAATAHLFFENNKWKSSVFQLGGGTGDDVSFEKIVVLAVLFVAVVIGVIAMTKAQRRIPTQSAKHVRGRRVYGGTKQFLPLKVNQAGVMPVIFASSLLVVPHLMFQALERSDWFGQDFSRIMADAFTRQGYVYTILYILLIYVFCYFWTAISFNPKDVATNLKDYGSFIPGYRPGKRTAEYLDHVVKRITYVGAAFLAVVAVIPTVITTTLSVDQMLASFYGGTGLLIVISGALDLVGKINSHLVMRNYPGLTED
jgi:preprotein translocase subunit SecY